MVVPVSHAFFRPELNAFLMSVCSSDADSCNTETVFCESELLVINWSVLLWHVVWLKSLVIDELG